jgi:PKHD-type hydroxylase
MIQYANTRHWQFDLSGIFAPVQVLRYGQDHHFAWHVDAGGGVTSDRKISFTLQLSAPDAYVGGELELMAGHMPTELPRDQGIALLFPSYVLHRVRPVTNGERWALVGWVQGPPFR